MTDKPDNPFVYPQEETTIVDGVPHREVIHHGLTMRDWAAAEIAAQLACNPSKSFAAVAKESYGHADALLVERARETEHVDATKPD